MSNVVILTAKGNNSSIPNKNVMKICGKPAMLYGIEAAKKAKLIDDVFVSTEDKKISTVAKKAGCKIIDRPVHLSQADTHHGDVIEHAVKVVKAQHYPDLDIVTVLLGNTVMVDAKLIDLSIQILKKRKELDSAMSVWQAQDDHPYRALDIGKDGYLKSFLDVKCGTSRQEYPKVYFYDQGVWTFRHKFALKNEGAQLWWWMGKNCFPIVRRWVTGRDFHSKLDIDLSEYWIKSKQRDVFENIDQIQSMIGEK